MMSPVILSTLLCLWCFKSSPFIVVSQSLRKVGQLFEFIKDKYILEQPLFLALWIISEDISRVTDDMASSNTPAKLGVTSRDRVKSANNVEIQTAHVL